jgi:hypothetical protein
MSCKYPRCEQHDKIKFNENKLFRGPPFDLLADPRLGNTGLDNVGSLTSHNPVSLLGPLRGWFYFLHLFFLPNGNMASEYGIGMDTMSSLEVHGRSEANLREGGRSPGRDEAPGTVECNAAASHA